MTTCRSPVIGPAHYWPRRLILRSPWTPFSKLGQQRNLLGAIPPPRCCLRPDGLPAHLTTIIFLLSKCLHKSSSLLLDGRLWVVFLTISGTIYLILLELFLILYRFDASSSGECGFNQFPFDSFPWSNIDCVTSCFNKFSSSSLLFEITGVTTWFSILTSILMHFVYLHTCWNELRFGVMFKQWWA